MAQCSPFSGEGRPGLARKAQITSHIKVNLYQQGQGWPRIIQKGRLFVRAKKWVGETLSRAAASYQVAETDNMCLCVAMYDKTAVRNELPIHPGFRSWATGRRSMEEVRPSALCVSGSLWVSWIMHSCIAQYYLRPCREQHQHSMFVEGLVFLWNPVIVFQL